MNLEPLPQIGFYEGADIRLQASGGDYEPFELRGRGINYLEISDDATVVEQGQPIELSWPLLSVDLPTRIRVEISLNNHGPGIETWIACEIEDTGFLVISEILVDALFEAGISGWPSVVFWRQTADATDISLGCVQLLVVTREARDLEFADEISCWGDWECPPGQYCLPNSLCG